MPPTIREHHDALVELCRQHRVARLDLFGSAAGGVFDETQSDLDFVVEFAPELPADERFDAYFSLREALEALFGRDVDLVEPGELRNPWFIRRVNQTREQVYAACPGEVSA